MINLSQITGHELPSQKTAIWFWNKLPDARLLKQGSLSFHLFWRQTWALFDKMRMQSLGWLSHYLGINYTAILGWNLPKVKSMFAFSISFLSYLSLFLLLMRFRPMMDARLNQSGQWNSEIMHSVLRFLLLVFFFL